MRFGYKGTFGTTPKLGRKMLGKVRVRDTILQSQGTPIIVGGDPNQVRESGEQKVFIYPLNPQMWSREPLLGRNS